MYRPRVSLTAQRSSIADSQQAIINLIDNTTTRSSRFLRATFDRCRVIEITALGDRERVRNSANSADAGWKRILQEISARY